MSISVDHATASALLEKAAAAATAIGFKAKSPEAETIRLIVTGSHLTYRYILVTALLAKATNPKINPLAIQAQARIKNAYDARSLCHKVIVPNEARLLHSSLGGSNEPYLNKPARTPYLDISNPVRGGNDRRTLESLCVVLPKFDGREAAYSGLCDAIFYAIGEEKRRDDAVIKAVGDLREAPAKIRAFLSALMVETHHGETIVLVSALLYWLLSRFKGEDWTIEVHPVNEAGSSSNQVGDIDVYRGQDLIYCSEVKDKVVFAADIQHATRKACQANSESLHIILGNSGSISDATAEHLESFGEVLGVSVSVFSGSALVEASSLWTPAAISLREIAKKSIEFAEVARMKQSTNAFLLLTIQSFS
jgi:hypothetical protein